MLHRIIEDVYSNLSSSVKGFAVAIPIVSVNEGTVPGSILSGYLLTGAVLLGQQQMWLQKGGGGGGEQFE